jgi:HSP20 family protein
MSLIPFMNIGRFFEEEFPSAVCMFPPTTLLRDLDRDTASILRRSSPAYEISEDDAQYKVSVDLPGVRPEDCQVNVEQNGRLLHLSGGRKIEKEDGFTDTRFDQKFTLGKTIDPTKISANLADGVIVITATKDPKLLQAQTVAITSNPHPTLLKNKDEEKKAE